MVLGRQGRAPWGAQFSDAIKLIGNLGGKAGGVGAFGHIGPDVEELTEQPDWR